MLQEDIKQMVSYPDELDLIKPLEEKAWNSHLSDEERTEALKQLFNLYDKKHITSPYFYSPSTLDFIGQQYIQNGNVVDGEYLTREAQRRKDCSPRLLKFLEKVAWNPNLSDKERFHYATILFQLYDFGVITDLNLYQQNTIRYIIKSYLINCYNVKDSFEKGKKLIKELEEKRKSPTITREEYARIGTILFDLCDKNHITDPALYQPETLQQIQEIQKNKKQVQPETLRLIKQAEQEKQKLTPITVKNMEDIAWDSGKPELDRRMILGTLFDLYEQNKIAADGLSQTETKYFIGLCYSTSDLENAIEAAVAGKLNQAVAQDCEKIAWDEKNSGDVRKSALRTLANLYAQNEITADELSNSETLTFLDNYRSTGNVEDAITEALGVKLGSSGKLVLGPNTAAVLESQSTPRTPGKQL